MNYLIGQSLKEYIKENNLNQRQLAIKGDVSEVTLNHILKERRTAREPFLSKLMDTELLKEPLKDYVKDYINENIDSLDVSTIIDLYNVIYNNDKQKD